MEAIFKLNDSIETDLNSRLSKSVIELEKIINEAFPGSQRDGGYFFFFDHVELQQWTEIVKLARELSYKIQSFVSCRLEVTIAPATTTTNDTYGTYAFGLDRVSGGSRNCVLDVKTISSIQLRYFYP